MAYLDDDGYLRNQEGVLIHRIIAFNHIYKKGNFPLPFSDYVVHHKDENKTNNSINNLEILTQEEHEEIHSINKYPHSDIRSSFLESLNTLEILILSFIILFVIGGLVISIFIALARHIN